MPKEELKESGAIDSAAIELANQKKSIAKSLFEIASTLKFADSLSEFTKCLQYKKSEKKINIRNTAEKLSLLSVILNSNNIASIPVVTPEQGFALKLDEPVNQELVDKLKAVAAHLSAIKRAVPSITTTDTPKLPSVSTVKETHSGLHALFSAGSLENLLAYVLKNVNCRNKTEVMERIEQGYIRLNPSEQKQFKAAIVKQYAALRPHKEPEGFSSKLSMMLKILLALVFFIILERNREDESLSVRNLLIAGAAFGLLKTCVSGREDKLVDPVSLYYQDLARTIDFRQPERVSSMSVPRI